MAAEQLQLGADDAPLGKERDDLVPEEVGIDPLPNPRCLGILMNDLTDAATRVWSEPVRLVRPGSRSYDETARTKGKS
jgi:hypothetical protein